MLQLGRVEVALETLEMVTEIVLVRIITSVMEETSVGEVTLVSAKVV